MVLARTLSLRARLVDWSCPASHCADAIRLLANPVLVSSSLGSDGDYVYWVDGSSRQQIVRCPRDGCSAATTVATIDMDLTAKVEVSGVIDQLVVHGDFLYLRAPNAVLRVPRDGGTQEVIYADPVNIGAITVTDDGVCIASDRLSGEVYRCPLEGCRDQPTALVARQAYPWAVLADGQNTYWMNRGGRGIGAGLGSVLACSNLGCDSPRTLAANITFDLRFPPVASNASSLFWAANETLSTSISHPGDLMRITKVTSRTFVELPCRWSTVLLLAMASCGGKADLGHGAPSSSAPTAPAGPSSDGGVRWASSEQLASFNEAFLTNRGLAIDDRYLYFDVWTNDHSSLERCSKTDCTRTLRQLAEVPLFDLHASGSRLAS